MALSDRQKVDITKAKKGMPPTFDEKSSVQINKSYMSFHEYQSGPLKVVGVNIPYDLDAKGFEAGKHGPLDYDFREDRITAAREVIRTSLKKARGEQPRTRSNWVQSKVEEKLGQFLYPGELIVAMLAENYAFARSGQECLFNVDTGTLNNLGTRQPYYAHRRR